MVLTAIAEKVYAMMYQWTIKENILFGNAILLSSKPQKSGKISRDNTSKQESNIREQEEEAESLDALGRICPQKDHKISGPSNTKVAQLRTFENKLVLL